MDLVSHVERNIVSRQLLRDGQSVLVAVSGGVDSMVLLDVLHRLAPNHRWKLTVAHFNHQLRGRASNADEQFVKTRAEKLKLECVRGRGDVRAVQRRDKVSLEMAARSLRRTFLREMAEARDIAAVALAHHADDQAELFLIRLLRGAGGEGLSGMSWSDTMRASKTVRLVRPLLDLRKSDLLAHARRRRLRFREDDSNRDTDILRNRIRHKLLPLLAREFEPAVVSVILRTMEIVGAESAWVREAAQRWLDDAKRSAFDGLHPALQRLIVRIQLQAISITPDFQLVESLRANSYKPVTASPGEWVFRDGSGFLRGARWSFDIGPRGFKFTGTLLDLCGRRARHTFDGLTVRWRFRARPEAGSKCPQRVSAECFDADVVRDFVNLRHWRPGDRFQPIGMKSAVKLQDLFTNAKIPAKRRRELVVATTGGGDIFWVEGLRIGEIGKITPATKRVLEWRWDR